MSDNRSFSAPPLPQLTLPVHDAQDVRVVQGVNEGDVLGDAKDLILEDAYALPSTPAQPMTVAIPDRDGPFLVAEGSACGSPGAPVFLDCVLTFMPPHGETIEALVLVETNLQQTRINRTYLYPMTAMSPGITYSLVTIDTENARARLAESTSISFTRGTRITLADGRQIPIEDLVPGDRILTRDSGPQPLRWIGHQTVRAHAETAPITIAAGALNNDAELTLSPSHRLFIYQRIDALKVGQKEVLVRARDLVDGVHVTQSEGGFVDYYQLLFDKHEIIYAEGIPAESLFVDQINGPALPEDLAPHTECAHAYELQKATLKHSNTLDMLKALKGGTRHDN